MKSNHGFTLLEAIVALTILSMGLMAAFGWFSQDIRHLIRINDLALEEVVTEEVLSRLELEDFTYRRSGRYQLADYTIDWQATAIEPPKAGMTPMGGQSLYDIALYNIELELVYKGRLISTPTTRITQSKKVRLSPAEM